MRYAELLLRPERGWFHRFDEFLAEEPDVTEEAIHQMNLLADGTAVVLSEYAGSRERVQAVLAEHYEHAVAYQTSAIGENTLMYAHIEPSDLVESLLAIPQEHGLVVDYPMEFTRDGRVRVTVVADDAALRDTLGEIPEDVHVEVTKTGSYRPGAERLFAELTARQQEIARAAVELGYYEEPRHVTYEDVADHLDCTATTVGEHLRKVESTILRAVVP